MKESNMKECLYPVGSASSNDFNPFYDEKSRTYDIDGIVKEFKDGKTVKIRNYSGTKEKKVFVLENVFMITDGIYILSDDTEIIKWEEERFEPTKENVQKALKLFKSHSDVIYIASAYETFACLLLNKLPIDRINKNDMVGSGFNYGVTMVLPKVDRRILILAEND